MNFIIRDASINDLDNGLLKVFIGGYRYHKMEEMIFILMFQMKI